MSVLRSAIVIAIFWSAIGLSEIHASDGQCDLVAIDGSTRQLAHDAPFVGELALVNLETGRTQTMAVSTVLLGNLDDSLQRAITSHDLRSEGRGDISLTTFDEASLTPTGQPGEFRLRSRLVVQGGQGRYNCGQIVLAGDSVIEFDLAGLGSASFSGLGKLCRCRPGDG